MRGSFKGFTISSTVSSPPRFADHDHHRRQLCHVAAETDSVSKEESYTQSYYIRVYDTRTSCIMLFHSLVYCTVLQYVVLLISHSTLSYVVSRGSRAALSEKKGDRRAPQREAESQARHPEPSKKRVNPLGPRV